MLEYVNILKSCGGLEFEIPDAVFNLVHYVILIIQIIVPILLIIWGMLDFAKGLIKGKDEDIKAGQKTFVSRLIVAVVVFLVITIVNLIITIVAKINPDGTADNSTIANCVACFTQGAKGADCK